MAAKARLPDRFRYETSEVHTIELTAMLALLRWRKPGQWNIFVGDGSALLKVLTHASEFNRTWTVKGSCVPLGSLRKILTELAEEWQGAPPRPKLRKDQEEIPETRNVRIKHKDDDKIKWMSKISYDKY